MSPYPSEDRNEPEIESIQSEFERLYAQTLAAECARRIICEIRGASTRHRVVDSMRGPYVWEIT